MVLAFTAVLVMAADVQGVAVGGPLRKRLVVAGTYLGGDPTDMQDCLQMDAYGKPATSPAASPELVSWETSYDCIPSE